MEHNYHFFWKSKLSNWTKSYFDHEGYRYCCGEQMMMHQKALLFEDYEIALKIMQSDNPKEIKDLGRQVKNFSVKVWDDCKRQIVQNGLYARFTQDKEAKAELLKYKGKIFVEASPYDRIWGIGYTKEDAMDNLENWGENLLGKILTYLSVQICA
jgi:ribA/ribD-fused uncharacterized protein